MRRHNSRLRLVELFYAALLSRDGGEPSLLHLLAATARPDDRTFLVVCRPCSAHYKEVSRVAHLFDGGWAVRRLCRQRLRGNFGRRDAAGDLEAEDGAGRFLLAPVPNLRAFSETRDRAPQTTLPSFVRIVKTGGIVESRGGTWLHDRKSPTIGTRSGRKLNFCTS